jgi:hypothetical protein
MSVKRPVIKYFLWCASTCVYISSRVSLIFFSDRSINWIHTIYTTIITTTDISPASFILRASSILITNKRRLFAYDGLNKKNDHLLSLENQYIYSTDKTYWMCMSLVHTQYNMSSKSKRNLLFFIHYEYRA